jgi:transposase
MLKKIMARPRQKLDEHNQAQEVIRRWKETGELWERRRLNVIRLGLEGDLSIAQIAQAEGISDETVRQYFNAFRAGGIAALLERRYINQDRRSRLTPAVRAEMEKGLAAGRWRTARALWHWLTGEHKLDIKPRTAYHYLGKCEARLKAPRKCHHQQEPGAREAFKESGLEQKFAALNLAEGAKVRLWVADEGRFGLISDTRRVWSLPGVRVVVPHQMDYEWSYVHGALEVGPRGESVFCFLPETNIRTTCAFLEQIAETDRAAVHVVIYDGAGAHPNDGHRALPANVRVIKLPPYCPELNPVEKVWDLIRDFTCNQIYPAIEKLEEKIEKWLWGTFWQTPANTTGLIGKGWLWDKANDCC